MTTLALPMMDTEGSQDAAGDLLVSFSGGLSESLASRDVTLRPVVPGRRQGGAEVEAVFDPPHITEFCQKLAVLEFP